MIKTYEFVDMLCLIVIWKHIVNAMHGVKRPSSFPFLICPLSKDINCYVTRIYIVSVYSIRRGTTCDSRLPKHSGCWNRRLCQRVNRHLEIADSN